MSYSHHRYSQSPYRASHSELLSHGFKTGQSWGDDKREFERAMNEAIADNYHRTSQNPRHQSASGSHHSGSQRGAMMLHPSAAYHQYAHSGHSGVSESVLAGYTDPPESSHRMGRYAVDDITPQVIRMHSGHRQSSYPDQYQPSYRERSYPDDYRYNSNAGSSISSYRVDTPSLSRSSTSYHEYEPRSIYESGGERNGRGYYSYHNHDPTQYHHHDNRDYYDDERFVNRDHPHSAYDPGFVNSMPYSHEQYDGYGSRDYEDYGSERGERAGYYHDDIGDFLDDEAEYEHSYVDDDHHHQGYSSGGSSYGHDEYYDGEDYPGDSDDYGYEDEGSSYYSD